MDELIEHVSEKTYAYGAIRAENQNLLSTISELKTRLETVEKVDSFDDLFDHLQQFEKLVNSSRAKKLEKSHDPLALVAHTGSSSRNTSSYYVTHPTSMVDYDDEYQQDDVQTNSEDPLVSAMLLLARAITQNFSNPTNNLLRTSSNTRNQAIIQGDMVNIQSRNSGNTGRNTRRAYVQEEVVEGSIAQNETENPKVRDSKYFMEQMLLAKQDEAGVILTDEQNDFLFADASRMEEIEELSANICLMARIQPADNTFDAGPSYDSAFISEVQSSSIKDNQEQMYPTHTKIINSTIGDDQIDSNIIFDEPNGNVNSGSVEKDTHVPDLYALEQLARNAYQEAEKQQLFAQKMEKLDNENVSLEFQVQSLIKERDNVKLEYQKLFDSIKKTRSQSQKEMDELIEHVFEKTYAYGVIRAENQNLLSTIFELKTRLKTVKKGVVAVVNRTKVIKSPSSLRNSFRFIKNPDQANLLEDLNKIWIGSHHLFASIARFDRKQNSQPNQSHQKQSNNTKPHETGHASHTTGGRSYASVLNGKEGTQKPVLAGPITKNITLENSDLLELSDTSSVVLAKCKYMGGLWLWIEFSSDESRLKFQKNTEMELYFTQRKLVSHNFIPDERMIWIEIDGLPLNAWTTNAFKKIAGNWGETVFVDEDADENIANGRVRVREFANWVPDFASLDNISQHDYESEASGNDQDIHSINESQEEGEINDKKEQMGYEMNAPDCSNNVTEKCGVVNNNMSNNVEGEILEDHFDGDCGIGHNLFSVGQFGDGDLEVAFRSNTCYIRNLEGDDLLIGGRDSNLYTISISDMAARILLLLDLVDGLPKFKYERITFVLLVKEEKARKLLIHPNWFQNRAEKPTRFNNNTSPADHLNTPSKEDLENLFGPKCLKNILKKGLLIHPFQSRAQPTQFLKETSSSTSSIIVEEHEAPPIETTSDETNFSNFLYKCYEFKFKGRLF
ncbi:hypothetical protein Tco_1176032 [Tanacetum coccineum]